MNTDNFIIKRINTLLGALPKGEIEKQLLSIL